MQNNTELRMAVLIDAENVPRKRMKAVMQELALYGTPTVKRIYGDWTSPNLASWKPELLENAITPVQQHSYTVGKNSSDSALIIDAMDILYGGNTDGFCLVSSDSDFTRLAIRLREAGKTVIGMGEKKTPKAFIAACDRFIYLEILAERAAAQARAEQLAAEAEKKAAEAEKKAAEAEKKAAEAEKKAAGKAADEGEKTTQTEGGGKSRRRKKPGAAEAEGKTEKAAAPEAERTPDGRLPIPEDTLELLRQSVSDLADEDGWAFMGELGNLLSKKQPDFDPRNFGYAKLTTLMKAQNCFVIDVRLTGAPHSKHIYVKIKD